MSGLSPLVMLLAFGAAAALFLAIVVLLRPRDRRAARRPQRRSEP